MLNKMATIENIKELIAFDEKKKNFAVVIKIANDFSAANSARCHIVSQGRVMDDSLLNIETPKKEDVVSLGKEVANLMLIVAVKKVPVKGRTTKVLVKAATKGLPMVVNKVGDIICKEQGRTANAVC